MDGFGGSASAAGFARSFVEPERFASALIGGQFDYLPLREEPFAATLRVLQLDGMVIQQADTSGHVARGAISPGLAVLMLNLQATQHPARMNGTEIGGTNAVLATGGAEIASHNPQRLSWAALALPLPLLEELAEVAPPKLRVHGALSVLALQPERAARLAGALSAAGRMVQHPPPELDRPACAAGLARALREEVAAALTVDVEIRSRPRAVADALRLVRAAEAFMDARLAQPVYTDELCAALGVSARRLHDGFRAAVGISPHSYLKSRRLMLARHALLAQRGRSELVKSVALDHGFWHLSHFARDYRALFGELPSETLSAA